MNMSGSARQASTGWPRTANRLQGRLLRAAGYTLALLLLLLVFAAYLQPAMAFQLAQQLWACY